MTIDAQHRQQVARGSDAPLRPCLDDERGYLPGLFQFAVQVEDVGQLFLAVAVHDVGSRQRRPFVHAHIQWRLLKAEGEAARLVVEMVTGDAQVGQQAVDMLHAIVAHPLFHISEVAPDEGESVVVDDIFLRIGILVETVEVTVRPQTAQNLAAVAAATERDVHIDPVGLNGQPVNALLQKHWYVVCLCSDNH